MNQRANLYLIDTPAPGRLATMARPRGGDRLAEEMAGLREAGVDVLVSALCTDECQLLDLVAEADAARAAGLDFVGFPFLDGTAPTAEMAEAVGRLADQLTEELRQGRFVVTHCRAGIGRSSILAGTVLVRLGLSPAEAWTRIRAARGLPVPDNLAQELWLHAFATDS
ncbi:MAG TPA: tyrosine protein phosphatase [Micromonosporaceae bacterium]